MFKGTDEVKKEARETAGQRRFHVMAKPIGPKCNLACEYCFYLEKERFHPAEHHWKMTEEVLESYVRQVSEAEKSDTISFAWQGGEPTLMGVGFFEKAVALQAQFAGGRQVANAIQTNGLLLDETWCKFLAENRFLVGISIDGPRELHDRFRTDRAGRGSFEQVMKALALLKQHRVDFNTLTVVHRHNASFPGEIYRFLKEAGSRFMQFIPVVERASGLSGKEVTSWSVEPQQYGEFLSSVFDRWVREDVGKVFVQAFDVALESWLGLEPGLCVFRQTCGDALVLEHDGDLYSCDHFVYPEFRLGTLVERPLQELAGSSQQVKFGKDKSETLPTYCRECPVLFACNGECPKHRFTAAPDGEPGLNYLCQGYRRFFHHIDPAMRFMAEELRRQRPPANVMQWMQEHDARIGRNDPCFCGSGAKFKSCHGV